MYTKVVGRSKKKKLFREKQTAGPKTDLYTRQSVIALGLFALAIVFLLAAGGKSGVLGSFIFGIFEFLFGKAVFLLPIGLVIAGAALLSNVRRRIVANTFFGIVLFFASVLGLVDVLFSDKAAGYIGFVIGFPFFRLFSLLGSVVIFITALAASILIIFNIPLLPRKKDTRDSKKQTAASELIVVSPQEARTEPAIHETEKKPEEKIDSAPLFIRGARLPAGESVGYNSPPLELLADDKGKPSSGDVRANANIMKRTLQNFGIDVEMSEVHIGPSVTQYTLRPAQGVKLSRITALQKDLALALAARSLRIEAPIPGRALVGIEVPNRSVSLVGLKSLLGTKEFMENFRPLAFAIGRDVAGEPVYADLAAMPHLLIAGSTGSGKSVSIHVLIMSLIYKNSPELLQFIFIDPKRVELTIYNDLPHLIAPVITAAKQAVQALVWATKEMDRRYDLLSESKCRDIGEYNAHIIEKKGGSLPYLVIVIDELADLMSQYGRAVEASIVRLAQLSRAVGLHLIVSTQRPSVDVITGLIKANITARIALSVASQVDSRTILDSSGAEKLLGNGDMLFVSSDTAKPKRVQGAFVSTKEVKAVARFLTKEIPAQKESEQVLFDDSTASQVDFDNAGSSENDDVLYEDARALVIEAQKASASYLQRRFRIGYSRAARLLDMLEEQGVIGHGDGAKPREVYVKSDEEAI